MKQYKTIRGKDKLLYMAGLFDGEGHITIIKTSPINSRTPIHCLRVGIGNNHKGVVEMFLEEFGGSNIYEEKPEKGRLVYKWYITTNKALKFIETIEPFLIVKKKQALLAKEFSRNKGKIASAAQRGDVKEIGRVVSIREYYRKEMKKLNGKQNLNLKKTEILRILILILMVVYLTPMLILVNGIGLQIKKN